MPAAAVAFQLWEFHFDGLEGWIDPGMHVNPPVEQTGQAFPWADDELEIVFHTLEESDATRDEWEELYEHVDGYPSRRVNDTWGWVVDASSLIECDNQTEHLSLEMLNHRGGFYGLGGGLLDPRLQRSTCWTTCS